MPNLFGRRAKDEVARLTLVKCMPMGAETEPEKLVWGSLVEAIDKLRHAAMEGPTMCARSALSRRCTISLLRDRTADIQKLLDEINDKVQ